MKRIVSMMMVLLLSGLYVGSAFAQLDDVMTLSPGGVDEISLMPSFECLSEIDFKDLGLSPDVFYPFMASALYGFEVSGGGGLSDGGGSGKVPKFCTPHWYSEPCGSCTYWNPQWLGKIVVFELWCLGVRVYRSKRCNKCAAG